MSDYNYDVRQASPAGVDAQAIDQGLRTYMISVYQYMTLGLAVTGVVAYATSATPVLFNAIYGTPLVWVVMLAPLAIAWFGPRVATLAMQRPTLAAWSGAVFAVVALGQLLSRGYTPFLYFQF